jgi:hypothetical protein
MCQIYGQELFKFGVLGIGRRRFDMTRLLCEADPLDRHTIFEKHWGIYFARIELSIMRVPTSNPVRRLCLLSGLLLLSAKNYFAQGNLLGANRESKKPSPASDQASKPRNLHGEGEVLPDDREMVRVIIGFAENADPAEALPPEATILHQYTYVNAVIAEMPQALVPEVEQRGDIEYVEEDSMAYPSVETVTYGIPLIQANDPSVPAPDITNPCFKICVVDSGFSLGHEDLVCMTLLGCSCAFVVLLT